MSGKRTIPKEEILEIIDAFNKRKYNERERMILYTLEYLHYVDVLNAINKRRDKLNLFRPNELVAFYVPEGKGKINEISTHCKGCLSSKLTYMRHTDKCNCACDFCYYHGEEEPFLPYWAYTEGSTRFPLDEVEMKTMLKKQILGKTITVGWLGREPLIDIEKARPIMEFIAESNTYQCLYTNGVYATKDTIQMLKDYGLDEMRFNLQATNFSSKVLSHLETACKILDRVTVETPIYSKSFNNFLKHKTRILESGIKQISMPELQLTPRNMNKFKDEGIIYRHRRGYVSPVSSRHYVYDLIEMAVDEKWNVIINDCSNDLKFFRDVTKIYSDDIKCRIEYATQFGMMPPSYYYDIVNKYVDTELEI